MSGFGIKVSVDQAGTLPSVTGLAVSASVGRFAKATSRIKRLVVRAAQTGFALPRSAPLAATAKAAFIQLDLDDDLGEQIGGLDRCPAAASRRYFLMRPSIGS